MVAESAWTAKRTPMTRNDDVVGCYDPAFEHDSCGVAFVVDLERPASHRVVTLGLTALENLAHRGAFGADPGTGDGAGALIQLPHRLYSQVAGFDLPEPGSYGTGMVFLPLRAARGSASHRCRFAGGLRGRPRGPRMARGARGSLRRGRRGQSGRAEVLPGVPGLGGRVCAGVRCRPQRPLVR